MAEEGGREQYGQLEERGELHYVCRLEPDFVDVGIFAIQVIRMFLTVDDIPYILMTTKGVMLSCKQAVVADTYIQGICNLE